MEDHSKDFAFEQWAVASSKILFFQFDRQVEHAQQLFWRKIGDGDEVFFHRYSSFLEF